jgi:hypothetical protein
MKVFIQTALSASSARLQKMLSFLRMPALVYLGPAVVAAVSLSLSGCSNGDGGSKYAEIRLLNVSPDYSSLDLYVSGSNDDTDSLKFQGVAYETLSNYSKMNSYTYDVKVKRNGVTSTLQTLSDEQEGDDTHLTYVAYGSTGSFGILKLNEDQTAANDQRTKLQVLNASEVGGLDLYLTDQSVSLDDATPVVSGMTAGGTSGTVYLDSGTYRLRVVGTGDTNDLRLDIPGISLESKQVLSLILTATPGGVLVNAAVLPQQGALETKHNTNARVRGAVGVSTGVTAEIGGVSLLTGAAVGVIGSHYEQVDASSAAVNLNVGGVAVPIATQALTAGGDYTMLIWSNVDGVQMSLISDDNRLATGGKAKIRVLNGLSGLGVPVTLAVDYSPVAEGIALGQASGYTAFDNGSEYQLDLSDADTGTNVLSRSEVSLVTDGVYTMFLSGSGTTVTGTLRKDR